MVTVCPEEPGRDPIEDFEAIENELRLHDERLAAVEKVLVVNRMDLPDVQQEAARIQEYAKEKGLPFFAISAATGEGIQNLINYLGEVINKSRADGEEAAPA